MNFDKAHAQLEKIVQEIEDENIPLEELAAKIKEAKELIAFCEGKLREVEESLEGLKK
jgi:exodeoxyribonuclease VII small subunit